MSGKLSIQNIKSILVVRPDAIGDVVLTLPLINTLKAQFPNAKITLYTRKIYTDLVGPHPAIDELIDSILDVKIGEFDMAVCPFLDHKIARQLKKAKIPIRIGDKNQLIPGLSMNYGVRLNYQDIRQHVVEQNLTLLGAVVSEKSRTEKMDLYVTAEGVARLEAHLKKQDYKNETLIAIQPCTGGSDKHWPASHYSELINLIQAHTPHKVLIMGAGKTEESVIQEIIYQCKTRPFTLTGFGTFPELKAVLKRCQMIIGTNTGPLHVAAALGCPVVSLFPSKFIKPSVWAPWGVLHRIVVSKEVCAAVCKPLTCLPACQDRIRVSQVWTSVNHLLHDISVRKKYSKEVAKQQWLNVSGSLAYYVTNKEDLKPALQVLAQSNALQKIMILKNREDADFIPKKSDLKIVVLQKWQLGKWVETIIENDIILLRGIKKSSLWCTLLMYNVALKVYAPPLIET